jgi:hypothetical protein
VAAGAYGYYGGYNSGCYQKRIRRLGLPASVSVLSARIPVRSTVRA